MNLQDYDFGINLSEIADLYPIVPLAPGEYLVQADQVSLKNTKLGDGKYLQFDFVIQAGPYTNRKIFQNIIVQHPNEDAKRIGFQWLKSFVIACKGEGNENLTLSLICRYLHHSDGLTCVWQEEGISHLVSSLATPTMALQFVFAICPNRFSGVPRRKFVIIRRVENLLDCQLVLSLPLEELKNEQEL